jgi:hypothetical protein
LGIDQWNFWLPPLPPFPFAAQQAPADLAAAETLAPADQQVAPRTVRPDPLRDILAALRRSLAGPDPVAPQKVDLQEVDRQEVDHINEPALVDELRVATPVNPRDDLQVQADLPRPDATPTNPLSGVPSGITSPPLTPLGKPKPFGKKPKPALETSNPSPQPSNESVGASNSPVATSNGSVGTPNPPKNRFNGPKKHRLTGSPSGSTASSARLAPSR